MVYCSSDGRSFPSQTSPSGSHATRCKRMQANASECKRMQANASECNFGPRLLRKQGCKQWQSRPLLPIYRSDFAGVSDPDWYANVLDAAMSPPLHGVCTTLHGHETFCASWRGGLYPYQTLSLWRFGLTCCIVRRPALQTSLAVCSIAGS